VKGAVVVRATSAPALVAGESNRDLLDYAVVPLIRRRGLGLALVVGYFAR